VARHDRSVLLGEIQKLDSAADHPLMLPP
jgi:hypothetical protein